MACKEIQAIVGNFSLHRIEKIPECFHVPSGFGIFDTKFRVVSLPYTIHRHVDRMIITGDSSVFFLVPNYLPKRPRLRFTQNINSLLSCLMMNTHEVHRSSTSLKFLMKLCRLVICCLERTRPVACLLFKQSPTDSLEWIKLRD